MSADNCIAVLRTIDNFEVLSDGVELNRINDGGIVAYRVVHTQGIDNFDWIEENQIYMLGKYMHDVWGKSPVFYDEKTAFEHAVELHDSKSYVEYGIVIIDSTKYSFN